MQHFVVISPFAIRQLHFNALRLGGAGLIDRIKKMVYIRFGRKRLHIHSHANCFDFHRHFSKMSANDFSLEDVEKFERENRHAIATSDLDK